MTTAIQAAAFWIGLNAILLIILSGNVGRMRVKTKVNLGHGENDDMLKAMRAQGNYIEYAPAAMLGLVLLAILGAAPTFIHILGAVFLFARIAHFLGLGLGAWPAGRTVGTVLTMLTLLVTGILLLYHAFV